MAKVSKNLLLDEAAVARGERYSELHETSLSRLVTDFLARLPIDDSALQFPPTVRRLTGIAAVGSGAGHRECSGYHAYLGDKYGER